MYIYIYVYLKENIYTLTSIYSKFDLTPKYKYIYIYQNSDFRHGPIVNCAYTPLRRGPLVKCAYTALD